MSIKYGSLFSGIGGFDLGFDRAGMECAWQVEYDEKARSVLSKHWPAVRKYNDVREVGAASLEPVDLVCGGFPCQDLSVAGKRAGFAGERSSLWFEFHRILAELTPQWVVIENVPGLLSSNGGADFAVLLRGLVELGYGVCWRILDAQYFGVAQRRRRVFIVGHLGDGAAAEVLFERDGSQWDSPPSRQARQVSATLPASGAGTSRTGNERTEAELLIAGTVSSKWAKGTGDPSGDEAQNLVAQAVDVRNFTDNGEISGTLQSKKSGGYSLNYQNPIAVKIDNTQSNGWGVLEDGTSHTLGGATDAIAYGISVQPTPKFGEEVTPTLTQPSPSGGGHPMAVAVADRIDKWVETEDRIRATMSSERKQSTIQEHVYFKTHGNTDALTTVRPPKVIGAGVRRLTPTECERLQGFPDGHTDGQSDSTRYRQLGNAVAVPVAEWIGRQIVAAASSIDAAKAA